MRDTTQLLGSSQLMNSSPRYPSLRKIRRVPNDDLVYAGGGPKFRDSFAVVATGMHHGYGKRMRFYCFSSDYLDRAIELRDQYAKAFPSFSVRVRHSPANGPRPWDGVTLDLAYPEVEG